MSRRFYVELIRPSHYDDDGYVIQWVKAWVPSNSLACLYGLARQAARERVLGDDVEIVITAWDESNAAIPVGRIVKRIRGAHGIVCMVGVQSNQYPRALDLSRRFRAAGVQVAIGGFHVSGCVAMLPETPAELQEAMDLGITLFAGEAEGRFDDFLRAAFERRLAPLYDHLADRPALQGQLTPYLPPEVTRRYTQRRGTFDAGRGCPFQCSFCTIINVQGRQSRYREAEDVERLMRENWRHGIRHYFITDDNFARNRNWEAILDRIAGLQQELGARFSITIQVDTLCHKIPGFVDKARSAGVSRVFIGLEAIRSDNLQAAGKKQNRTADYREMLLTWKRKGVMTYCGYILGFPDDSPERILGDVETIQRELPLDVLELFFLTPLPGSADHKALYERGAPIEPDLNAYDLEHVCTKHPRMSREEWEEVYERAWDVYYSMDHIETLMRRTAAAGRNPKRIMEIALMFHACYKFERLHPLQGGFFRRKRRRDRRPGLPVESPLVFYPRRAVELVTTYGRFLAYAARLERLARRVKREAAARERPYADEAMPSIADSPPLQVAVDFERAGGTNEPTLSPARRS